jgi:competence protein ComEA
MDRFGEWQPIAVAATEDDDKPASTDGPAKPAKPEANANNVRLVGLLAAGVLAVVGVAIWFASSGARPSLQLNGQAGYFDPQPSGLTGSSAALPTLTQIEEIVVDVEGAVLRPGLHHLTGGSRVGDAISAAGGYSPQVDISAASASLNLAEALKDGAKIHVPVLGEAAAVESFVPREPSSAGQTGGGLIDVNTATTEELDTLPGIGPVTAGKIIAAREVTPFTSVDDLLAREVVGAATLEKIRALITVGP